jgi:WD40 repeat protein
MGEAYARSVLLDEQTTRTGDLYIRSICFSPDGKYLATGAEDRQIRVRRRTGAGGRTIR